MRVIASKRGTTAIKKHCKIAALLFSAILTWVSIPQSGSLSAETLEPSPIAKPHKRKAHAEETPLALPPEVKVPSYTVTRFPFHDGERLVYQASWLGIPAARGWFELHRNKKNPELWNVEAWIVTSKVVDLLFKMRDYMRERVTVSSLKTQDIYQEQRENQRSNDYTITFDQQTHLVVSTKKNKKGTEVHQFIATNAFGPISGAMMALSQDITPGTRLAFDVFSGLNRYVFDFSVVGKERVQVPVGTFDAFKVSPGIVYLSNGKLRKQARETTIWISADKQHLPLRMEAVTFIGNIYADLVQIDGPPVQIE